MTHNIFLSRSIFSATFRYLKVPAVKFSKVNKQPPVSLCSASLKKAMAAEDWSTALCLIEQVVEDKEIKFTNEQMLSAFEACERTRHGDLIVRLLETKFDDIKKHQTKPSLVRALKVSFESDGDPLTKLKLVQRVLNIFEAKKIYLDKFGLARALGFCVKACNSAAALKMLESFANVADIVCFNVAISACASEGHSSQALLLLSRMRERGLYPDSVSYNAVVFAFLKNNDGDGALRVLREMQEFKLVNEITINTLTTGFMKLEPMTEQNAKYIFEALDMCVENPREAYNVAINAATLHGRGAVLNKLIDKMYERDGCSPDHSTFSVFIGEAVRSGSWQSLEKLVKQSSAISAELSSAVLTEAARRCASNRHSMLACRLLSNFPTLINRAVIESVMIGCKREGRAGSIRKLIDQAIHLGITPTQRMFTIAIRHGCRAKPSRALKYIDQMISLGVHPNVINYSAAILVCGNGGAWQSAKKLIYEMRECGIRTNIIAYANAIDAAGKAGKWDEALKLLELISFSDDPDDLNSGLSPNVVCYNFAISASAAANRPALVRSLLDEMRTRGLTPNADTYRRAIFSFGGVGEHNEVLHLFDEMKAYGLTSENRYNHLKEADWLMKYVQFSREALGVRTQADGLSISK